MRVCQIVGSRPLRWHLALADLLHRAGHEVVLCRAPDAGPALPASVGLVAAFEKIAYGPTGCDLIEPVAADTLPRVADLSPDTPFDLAVVLTGEDDAPIRASRTLAPLFGGVAGEAGAVAALIRGVPFSIGLLEIADGHRRRLLFPAAADDRLRIAASLANMCSRLAETIVSYAAGDLATAGFSPSPAQQDPPPAAGASRVARHALATLRRKTAKRLAMLARNRDRWTVGWRDLAQGIPLALDRGGKADYHLIPDDGARYFADPFLFEVEGATHLFVEEFDYGRGKGVISVFERDESGFGRRRVVLERPYHLSYPFVFRDGGSVWMLPECGETGRVELYRAVRYPDRWELATVPIEGVKAYDATLHRDDRGYWLFATTALWQSSTSDRLVLFHARSLLGPWTRCGPETELRDVRAARPAGMIRAIGGQMIRPAQDCHDIYGGTIQLCAVSALERNHFRQTATGRIEVVGRGGTCGAHTYNLGRDVEVVDVYGFSRTETRATLRHVPLTEPPSRESSVVPPPAWAAPRRRAARSARRELG